MQEQSEPSPPTHIVVVGSSAGGISALQSLLPGLPEGRGIAYVLAQHLDPSHPSLLDKILQRDTALPVVAIGDDTERTTLAADTIYIVLAHRDVKFEDGHLLLGSLAQAAGPRHVVDALFASAASAYPEHTIGIILSGSGSDGLQGIRSIKAAQGIAIIQDPATAEYAGMPGAVISERLADVVCAPEKIGDEILQLLDWATKPVATDESEAEIFQSLVRALVRKTGFAFDHYKESTLRRRVDRRRVVNKCIDLSAYLTLVSESDSEAELLLQDTLISVTQFFRDTKAFSALQSAIHSIVGGKKSGEPIRVWVPGCATGEEAFSIAIMLAEELGNDLAGAEVQLFATDIDEQAINVARKSVYLRSAVTNVPPALLEKYFVSIDGTYQIAPPVRDMVTFARHDLMQDPPFSRLDMVSCRNVLIYFKRAIQERLIGVFHCVLLSGGYLVLGPSESTGKLAELFESVDPHAKLFCRRELESLPPAVLRAKQIQPKLSHLTEAQIASADLDSQVRNALFDQYAPPNVVVDQRFNIVHTHGDTSKFIQLPEGNISVNLLDMAVPPLRVELRLILQKSEREQKMVKGHPIVMDSDQGKISIRLICIPIELPKPGQQRLMVLFESQPLVEMTVEAVPEEKSTFRIRELEQELTATRDHLQTNIEELEASNEELQSINEEYQSTTEELQSANEELQSTNDELSTVNEELRVRTSDLSDANRDLEAILNTALSGIVVLDSNLRVTRYSAASREIFDLLPTSIGKPLITIGGTIDLALLSKDIQQALSTKMTTERELELGEKVYLVRFIPQVSNGEENGLLISFVDATESLRSARESQLLAEILKHSIDAITLQALDGGILAWNRGAEHLYGYAETEALDMNIADILPEAEQARWRAVVGDIYENGKSHTLEGVRQTRDGGSVKVSITASVLKDPEEKPYAIATIERDISALRAAEAHRRQSELAHESRLTTAGEMAAGLAHELNQPITAIIHFCDAARSIAIKSGNRTNQELMTVVTDISRQSQRAGEIINNLKHFLGHRDPVRHSQSVNAIVTESVELIKIECERHNVDVSLLLYDNLPAVSVDRAQISQVLINLMRNSIESMVEANTASRRVLIRTSLDDNLVHSVQVSVEDNGPGVEPEMCERLFEPFHTNRPNGLGMGLWISRSVIEGHGGRLWADTDRTEGAGFHFALPPESTTVV